MNDFDQMLGDVLHDDGRVEPPAGIEMRILASLSVKGKASPAHSFRWIGIAAALVIGLSTMGALMLRGRPTRFTTAAKFQAATSPIFASRELEDHIPARLRPTVAAKSGKRSFSKKMNRQSKSAPQLDAIRIDSLEIGPLVISPIEIASIAIEPSVRKGSAQ